MDLIPLQSTLETALVCALGFCFVLYVLWQILEFFNKRNARRRLDSDTPRQEKRLMVSIDKYISW